MSGEALTVVECDSSAYDHTFVGILNAQGQFWTPIPFHDEQAARAYLERWAVGDYRSMLKTHRIVPVRVRLNTLPAAVVPEDSAS